MHDVCNLPSNDGLKITCINVHININIDTYRQTSMEVQYLRLRAPNAEGPGSILGPGTRSHILQLRVYTPQLKLTHTAAKT